MNYEELVESKKSIGDMSKEELFTYCNGLLDEIWEFEKEVKELLKENTILKQTMSNNSLLINENAILHSIIKEVREKIESVQLFGLRSGKTLIATLLNDILKILDKENSNE